MAVSEMSRRSCRRLAYPLRQSPEKAEMRLGAHSTPFGNFRNLPKQTRVTLVPRSAISGEKDAVVPHYQVVRQFPTTEEARNTCPSGAEAPRSRLAPCRFFSGNCRTAPKAPNSIQAVTISRWRPCVAIPLPAIASPLPPTVPTGNGQEPSKANSRSLHRPLPSPPEQEEVVTTQILAPAPAHRGGRESAKRDRLPRSLLPFNYYRHRAVRYCTLFFIPFLDPSLFCLHQTCTHRDKG